MTPTKAAALSFDQNNSKFVASSDAGFNIYNLNGVDKSLELKYKDEKILKMLRKKFKTQKDTIFLIEHHFEKPLVAVATKDKRGKLTVFDYENDQIWELSEGCPVFAVKFFGDFILSFQPYYVYARYIHDLKNDYRCVNNRQIPYNEDGIVAVAHECTALGGLLVAYPCNFAKTEGKIKLEKAKDIGKFLEWSDHGWFELSDNDEKIYAMALTPSGNRLAVATNALIQIYSILPQLEYLCRLRSHYLLNNWQYEYQFTTVTFSPCGDYIVANTNGDYAYAAYLFDDGVEEGDDRYIYSQKRGVSIKCKPKVKRICGITKLDNELGVVIATAEAVYVYSMPKSPTGKIKPLNAYHLDVNSSESKPKYMTKEEFVASLIIGYPSPQKDLDCDIDLADVGVLIFDEIPAGYAFKEKQYCKGLFTTKLLLQKFFGYQGPDPKRQHAFCYCEEMAVAAEYAKRTQLKPYRPQTIIGFITKFIAKKYDSFVEWFTFLGGNIQDLDPDYDNAAIRFKMDIAAKEKLRIYLESFDSQPCHYTCSCYKD